MDRDWLIERLDRGWSLEAIGRDAARHPSTVAYWISKHGLEANGKAKHSPRGRLDREQLEPLIEQGLSLREIADRLDRSQRAIRYWIEAHCLPSPIEIRHVDRDQALACGTRVVTRTCAKHGRGSYVVERSGRVRCRRCRAERVVAWRRRTKERLANEAGGRCTICGYDSYLGALEFHHVDPEKKSFGLSMRGITRSIDDLRAEAAKCVLLCGNCHAEVEAGLVQLPPLE